MSGNHHDICSVKHAGALDSRIRRWFQNPRSILAPYLREGMTVVDYGCGPGFFTLDMASLVGETGHVVAADLQQGMLDIVAGKLRQCGLEKRVELHVCGKGVALPCKADFILLFYMVHEVPDKAALFAELASSLKPDGRILVVEPPVHVSKTLFLEELKTARKAGLVPFGSIKTSMNKRALLGLDTKTAS
jgi:ubiquinone/menaquinone biosynthesis C-methylase UbiE